MDPYEATNVLMAKIRTLDPENASKIMGYILIQDFAERDMLRLAYGPETLLQNLILDAKIKLGLFSSMLSTSTPAASTTTNPSSPSPLQQQQQQHAAAMLGRLPVAAASDPFSQPSPRGSSLVSSISPRSSPFLSYDNIRNGSAIVSPFSKNADSTVAHMGPPSGAGGGGGGGGDFLDEYQLSDYLSFLDDSSKSDEFGGEAGAVDLGGGFPAANGDAHFHRRRFSESDVCFDAEGGGFGNGFRPCMYFSKGFCKNGDNCKFNHGGGGFDSDHLVEINGGASGGFMVGSPRELEGLYLQHQQQQQEAMMRMKVLQHQHQQRLAYTKYMNFLLQQRKESQRLGAAAMMADEFHKFCRFGPERNDFFTMGMAEKANSASRQIYLTFPADSTFKDEDVSHYFSTFGPVEDVRIPYQQKRMFGFVTFVHPETVKLILARGNPHFICDSRVLVKPYKEKGKILNNRREQLLPHHHLERGNFSPGSSPSGLDPRELYDAQLGEKMIYNTQEMMLRRKLEEQAELQQAIELQERRLINLQLPVVRGDYVQRHQRSFSVGSPVSLSPPLNQTAMLNGKNEEVLEGATLSAAVAVDEQNLEHDVKISFMENNGTLNEKEESSNSEDCNVHQCHESNAEDGLPDSLFTSAVEPSGNQLSDHSSCLAVVKENAEFSVSISSESDSSVSSSSSD